MIEAIDRSVSSGMTLEMSSSAFSGIFGSMPTLLHELGNDSSYEDLRGLRRLPEVSGEDGLRGALCAGVAR